jgi:iron-sulfur cluster repair protein YtfE (RIC family)
MPSRGAVVHDPIAILKRDHRETSAVLHHLASSEPGAARRRAAARVTDALQLHMAIEERLVHPLVALRLGDGEERESTTEHQLARSGLDRMNELVDERGLGAAVAMVTAGIRHHVREEERVVFPKLKASLNRDELRELGDAVAMAKRARRA